MLNTDQLTYFLSVFHFTTLPEYVSSVGAAKFPAPAQTYFCDC